MIGKELDNPEVLPENIYNIGETGVLLSIYHELLSWGGIG
jgi:hypothetical protein